MQFESMNFYYFPWILWFDWKTVRIQRLSGTFSIQIFYLVVGVLLFWQTTLKLKKRCSRKLFRHCLYPCRWIDRDNVIFEVETLNFRKKGFLCKTRRHGINSQFTPISSKIVQLRSQWNLFKLSVSKRAFIKIV